jgi:cytochrome c-type biogenesis protein CcmH
MTPRTFLLALLIMLGLLLAGPAVAQESEPIVVTDDEVNQVAKKLFCPVCENVPLDVCPTPACIQWRATIREKLEAGWSEAEILDYFALLYGERALARPSTRGINILIWIGPPALVVVGGFALWRYLSGVRAASAGAQAGVPPAPPSDDEYVLRLEQELRRRQ